MPFSEGDWGNRSLGIKERFPQKYMEWLVFPFAVMYTVRAGCCR